MPGSLLALLPNKKLHRHRSCRCKGGAWGVCRAVEPNKVENGSAIGQLCGQLSEDVISAIGQGVVIPWKML